MKSYIAIFALLSGCSHEPAKQRADEPAKSTAPASVGVVRLSRTTLETTLRLPGELAPYEAVDIYARVTGVVAVIDVDRGSPVRKGDVLLRVSAPELNAQRLEAEARASSAASTHTRLQDAARTPGAVAEHEVELARTAMEGARAHAASLQALEGFTTIRAPFAGIVTLRNVHPGALVSPNDKVPLVRLESVSRLRLTVPVPEQATGSVVLGSPVSFAVSAHPGVVFRGTTARRAASIETATRTMPVELDVTNDDGRLAPGAYAEVDWPVHHEATFLVPRTAIVQTAARVFVICVREDKAARVDVRRGISRGNDVEIFGAVSDGDLVVQRASEDLVEGGAVHPVIASAGTPAGH